MQYQTYCEAIVASSTPVNPRFREYTKKEAEPQLRCCPNLKECFKIQQVCTTC
jgi:hypothetical protein